MSFDQCFRDLHLRTSTRRLDAQCGNSNRDPLLFVRRKTRVMNQATADPESALFCHDAAVPTDNAIVDMVHCVVLRRTGHRSLCLPPHESVGPVTPQNRATICRGCDWRIPAQRSTQAKRRSASARAREALATQSAADVPMVHALGFFSII